MQASKVTPIYRRGDPFTKQKAKALEQAGRKFEASLTKDPQLKAKVSKIVNAMREHAALEGTWSPTVYVGPAYLGTDGKLKTRDVHERFFFDQVLHHDLGKQEYRKLGYAKEQKDVIWWLNKHVEDIEAGRSISVKGIDCFRF